MSAPGNGTDAALQHSREVLAELFGPPTERDFAVRYWNGTLEPGRRSLTAPRPYGTSLN